MQRFTNQKLLETFQIKKNNKKTTHDKTNEKTTPPNTFD